MAFADCECCESTGAINCPTLNWVTLHRWNGNYTVPNDLRLIHSTSFRLQVNVNGSIQQTGILSADSTALEIKNALEGLSNVGIGLVVSPGATLPLDEIKIEFNSTLTIGQNIPEMEILDNSEGWQIKVLSIGVSGQNTVQSLSRRPGVWDAIDLDKYPGAVWQWKVVAIGTSAEVSDLTKICVQQNRKEWRTFIAPIRDTVGSFYGVSFRKLRWLDSTITGLITGGTFSINLRIGGNLQTFVLPYSATSSQALTAIQTHPRIVNAGIVTVTGGPLPIDRLVFGFLDAVEDIDFNCTSSLTVTPQPTGITRTVAGSETKFDYNFPVNGGSFVIKVVDWSGVTTQSTNPISYNCDYDDLVSALTPITILRSVPTISSSFTDGTLPTSIPVPAPGTDEIQRFFVNNVEVVGGTFRLSLTVNGNTETTGPILHDASITFLYAALRSLPNVLSTDDFKVVHHGRWGFQITFKGTLGQQNVSMMSITNNLNSLGVSIETTTNDSDNYEEFQWSLHTTHTLTWDGLTSQTPVITAISSLSTEPDVIIESVGSNTSLEFQNWLEPLNVGTIWSHYLRDGWGNSDNRRINIYRQTFTEFIQRQITEPNGPGGGVAFGPPVFLPVNCGDGFNVNAGCSLYKWSLPDYPEIGQEFDVVRMRNSGDSDHHRADFNSSSGKIQITSDGTLRFAFMIRCVGCHYSSEFNMLGVHENNINSYWSQFDTTQPEIYDPLPGISGCATELKQGGVGSGIYGPACRSWRRRFDNVPHSGRITFSSDGFDVHLINKKFVAEGEGFKTRKPPCLPDVVAFCDGYWLQTELSRKYPGMEPQGDKCVSGCPPKPSRDSVEEHPVVNLDRLKMLFGTNFSFWGGWIDIEASLNNSSGLIKCRFDQFDLSDIKMIILGGLPVRPQHVRYVNVSDPRVTFSDTITSNGASAGATEQLLYKPWEEIETYRQIANVLPDPGYPISLVNRNFESGTLDPLKRWLSLGNRTLLIDGGVWPTKFLSEMGLRTTMETFAEWADAGQPITANTLNGSLRFGVRNVAGMVPQPTWYQGNPIWGRNPYLSWTPNQTSPEWLYIKPQQVSGSVHPFNIGGTAIAATQHYHHPINNEEPMYEEREFAPAAGLRTYTTAVPLVNPGSGSVILAKCQGEIAKHPWWNPAGSGSYVTANVDYPAIVAESYAFKGGFKLSFTNNSTTEITGFISPTASSSDIQTALSALTNVGSPISVIGGPLPGSIDITFDSPLTAGQNVTKLVVIGTSDIQIRVTQEGGLTKNEIQRITGTMVPSRVIIHGICELVGQTQWGHNYRDPSDQVSDIGTDEWGIQDFIGEDDLVFCDVQGQPATANIRVEPQYNRNGYGWGKGLTYICQDSFLVNLFEQRSVY